MQVPNTYTISTRIYIYNKWKRYKEKKDTKRKKIKEKEKKKRKKVFQVTLRPIHILRQSKIDEGNERRGEMSEREKGER